MREELESCIRDSHSAYRCDYYAEVIAKIYAAFDSAVHGEKKAWLQTFKSVLARVKADLGVPGQRACDPKRVLLPLGRKKSMAAFYEPSLDNRRLICDFKVEDR